MRFIIFIAMMFFALGAFSQSRHGVIKRSPINEKKYKGTSKNNRRTIKKTTYRSTGESIGKSKVNSKRIDMTKDSIEQNAPILNRIYDNVEQIPSYPGGLHALMNYLSSNVHYPYRAQVRGIQGRVVVSFIVEKDGSISNAQVVQSIFPDLDEESLRVVRAMPRWTPGKVNGEYVRVRCNVPISFRLQ